MRDSPATLPYFTFKPRPITDRDWWARVARDPLTRPMIEQVLEARRLAKPATAHPSAADYLAARRINDRGRIDYYWGAATFLTTASIARCVDGAVDEGNDDELLNAIWLFLSAPTWVLSAHLPEMDLPFIGAPQLDLMACDMAARMAELLEVMRPWIDAQSGTLARSIIHEIDRRVLTPFVEIEQEAWFDFSPGKVWNNWSGVCAGSILTACEALRALGQERPKAREKALRVLDQFFARAFTPAGECDEGIGYWSYGVGVAVAGLSRLDEAELRRHVDCRRLAEVASYPERVHLFGDSFFSGNDAALTAACPAAAAAWLAGATGSAWLAGWARRGLAQSTQVGSGRTIGLRTLDARLRLPGGDAALPAPPRARYVPDQQAAIFQFDRLHVTVSGGHNDEAHNHNDLGHINAWVDERVVLLDLGAPRYTADIFGPKRYTYLATSSRGHSCPLIHNAEQCAGREALGRVLALDLDSQRVVLDLSTAYPPEAKLCRWTRELARNDAVYDLVDEFTTTEPVRIENVFWSCLKPHVNTGMIACGPLLLRVDPTASVHVSTIDPAEHHLRKITEEVLYRIGISYQSSGNVPLRVVTMLTVHSDC